MKQVETTQTDHGNQITQARTSEQHLVQSIHEVRDEIRAFKNYALGTMLMFIVSLVVALFMLINAGAPVEQIGNGGF